MAIIRVAFRSRQRSDDPWSNDDVRIVAVVLAAGEGRRIGGPKALLPIGGDSFLAHACRLVARPGIHAVVAVLGAAAARVQSEGGVDPAVSLVVNEAWPEGMLSSVWRGLDAAEALGAQGVLLHPVDHPRVAPETIDRVVAALEAGAFVAVPTHEERRGHPGGFGPEAILALRGAPLDRGARAVLEAHPERVVHVPGDPGCRMGINTQEQYQKVVGD